MKKLIAVAAVLVASVITANSQDTKMWLGGTASFASSKTDQDGAEPTTNGVFSPGFGYNLNETMTIGMFLNITGGKSTDANGDLKTSGFAVNPFFRYNKAAGDKFTIFGQFNILIGSEKSEYEGGPSSDGTSYFGVGISPGIDYALTDAFSITASVGALSYESQNNKDAEVKTNNFNFGIDLNALSFGLFYHF